MLRLTECAKLPNLVILSVVDAPYDHLPAAAFIVWSKIDYLDTPQLPQESLPELPHITCARYL